MANKAAVLPEVKARIIVEQRGIPTPRTGEILIKNHAIATNPIDYKVQDTGLIISTYPIVLGCDVCGEVQAVGDGVKRFQKGDRVAGFAGYLASSDIDQGGFQEYTLVKSWAATKIPDGVSYEEGAILPLSIATAGVGIFSDLQVPRPGGKRETGGFLVWGASSSVGSAAVQIATILGFSVVAVASKQHHVYLTSLGAAGCFDYKEKDVVGKIVAATKNRDSEIKLAYDAVSDNSTWPQCCKVLEAFGGGRLCLTMGPSDESQKPSNITMSATGALKAIKDPDLGSFLFNDWLEQSLANKTYVPSPGIQIVEGGIDSVQRALDMHKAGVSGKKLVLALA